MWWLLTIVPYPVGWVMGLGGVLALVGRGWHRRLLCGGMLLSVMAVGALILLCTLRGRMPPVGFWLLVILPHGLGLIAALTGGVYWMIESFRAPAMIIPSSGFSTAVAWRLPVYFLLHMAFDSGYTAQKTPAAANCWSKPWIYGTPFTTWTPKRRGPSRWTSW